MNTHDRENTFRCWHAGLDECLSEFHLARAGPWTYTTHWVVDIATAAATMFTVGVTGHRSERLDPELAAAVRTQVRQALIELQGRHSASECRLLSGLADGADQIVAEEALDLGWSLEAMLPFAVEDYDRHMPDDRHRAGLARLLERSIVRTIVNATSGELPDGRHYGRLADAIVDKSDALLAVWDGLPSERVGGTYDVIGRAQAKGMRVLWVALDGRRRPQDLPSAQS